MSGVDIDGKEGARDPKGRRGLRRRLRQSGGRRLSQPRSVRGSRRSPRRVSTPLVVADGKHVLGIIELKDIVKGGIKERFAELRRMGIKTVMITGDNPMTAAAIAAEAGGRRLSCAGDT